jgi:hypothetical protein
MPLMADRSYGRVPVLFANAILRGTDAGRSAMAGLDVGLVCFSFLSGTEVDVRMKRETNVVGSSNNLRIQKCEKVQQSSPEMRPPLLI